MNAFIFFLIFFTSSLAVFVSYIIVDDIRRDLEYLTKNIMYCVVGSMVLAIVAGEKFLFGIAVIFVGCLSVIVYEILRRRNLIRP